MKKLFTIALGVVFGAACASAQYFCTDQGKIMYYKSIDSKEKEPVETVIVATVVNVDKAADGQITSRLESKQSDANNPFIELKTYMNFSYDPTTDVTKVVVMSAEDFKNMLVSVIKESAQAAGMHRSEMELADLEKVMSTKGEISFELDPKAAADSKLANATLRLNAGQMNMTMNLWDGKFLGSETITTESGDFDCLKISYVLRTSSPNGNEKRNMTDWYAKGVGLVRSVETDKKGNVISEDILRVIKEPRPAAE